MPPLVFKNPRPLYQTSNPLMPVAGVPSSEVKWPIEAIVVDVIVNEEHQEYSRDGYNVGSIRFRDLHSQIRRPKELLSWAIPLDANIEQFPLKNEIVHIFPSLGKFYYTRKINLGNRPTHQAWFGLEKELDAKPSDQDKLQDIETRAYAPQNETVKSEKIGNYFQDLSFVYRLRHWEGDTVYEGRSGHSIRFGAAWRDERVHGGCFQSINSDQAPNILIRVGPNEAALKTTDTYAARVVEDINEDKTSLWMVSDQVVPLKLSTEKEKSVHAHSVAGFPPRFDGNQFVINTGRFILNTKNSEILLHSAKGFYVTTLNDATLDVQRDYRSYIGRDKAFEIIGNYVENVAGEKKLWIGQHYTTKVRGKSQLFAGTSFTVHAGKRASVVSPIIIIGDTKLDWDNTDNPAVQNMVLGNTLVKTLTDLIDALLKPHFFVNTPAGYGTINPEVEAKLRSVQSSLNEILSRTNYVARTNKVPESPGERDPIRPR